MAPTEVLGPAVAGRWYPARRADLVSLVDRLLADAQARARSATRPPAALIAPHAGFSYSGAVAASAFRLAAGASYDRIVILGPSHYFGFPGAAVPDAARAYRTPLGDVTLDRDALASLRGAPGFRADDRLFDPEHALESEIPFLQRVLGEVPPLVPILMGGSATTQDASATADILAPLVDSRTLVVVSSDFTHFGPRFGFVPFESDVPEEIERLDLGAVRTIERGDADGFTRYVEETGATICGRRAIEVLLRLRIAASGASLLSYDTSGRMTATWDHSVSYAALALPAPSVDA